MKRNLSEEKFPLIPAGEQTVRIAEIDESKYADFQALTVVVEDAAGATARVNFNFLNDDGSPNDTADFVYGRMCRAALDDQTIDEVDSNDLIGRFVVVEVAHSTGSKGGTFANIKKWIGAGEPFATKGKKSASTRSTRTAKQPPKRTAQELLAEARAKNGK